MLSYFGIKNNTFYIEKSTAKNQSLYDFTDSRLANYG